MSFSKPLIMKAIFLFQISLLPSPSSTFYFLLSIFSYFHNAPGFPHWVSSEIHIPFVFNHTAEDPALTKFNISIQCKHKSPFNNISYKIYRPCSRQMGVFNQYFQIPFERCCERIQVKPISDYPL